MAGAATLRLREALQDYVDSEVGDGGGNARSAQSSGELVSMAQDMLSKIGGADDSPTPGKRAAQNSMSAGPGTSKVRDAAKAFMRS